MNWLNINTFLEHGELGIMALVIILASLLIFKVLREQGRREDRAIQAMVNNTKAMQGVIGMAKEIKRAVAFCPRRLKIELEHAEMSGGILAVMEGEEGRDDPEPGLTGG